MEVDVLNALRAADDPVHWECPPGFAWEAEMAAVEGVRLRLEVAAGHTLLPDRGIQDASHFAELYSRSAPRDVPGFDWQVSLTYVAIRFSAFGRLVTIWGNVPEAPLDPRVVAKITAVLEEAGYVVVPRDALEEEYDGNNRFRDGIPTWWCRFFSYC